MRDLVSAAQAVVDRWDSPDWSDGTHTLDYINRVRKAIAAYKEAEAKPVAWLNAGMNEVCLPQHRASYCSSYNIPLYTHPSPLRRLTDAEILDIATKAGDFIEDIDANLVMFANAIMDSMEQQK